MGISFSAIDLQTRLEVQDLLSRFCHALDRNMTKEWIELFPEDGCVEAPRFGTFCGRAEIARLPDLVREHGKGCWRHYLNNMYMDRMPDSRDLQVEAYCTVSDWSKKGNVVRSWDFSARVGKRRGWKIVNLLLSPVAALETCERPLSMQSPAVPLVADAERLRAN
ncbi:MAG: nuclear transport factor 2 family protein [Sphingobium sp.]|uniref:nuclear transport factor 2 family protein n=1 Tax=Sphingobium sp. TaxID=1912891 RepID=UPI0029B176CD|nr:nuclear transport factor 2 family protein [Sphingobium sp.]MDX3909828.1 nuclear transport factor 2 family protein [Sphingobium sp.]